MHIHSLIIFTAHGAVKITTEQDEEYNRRTTMCKLDMDDTKEDLLSNEMTPKIIIHGNVDDLMSFALHMRSSVWRLRGSVPNKCLELNNVHCFGLTIVLSDTYNLVARQIIENDETRIVKFDLNPAWY